MFNLSSKRFCTVDPGILMYMLFSFLDDRIVLEVEGVLEVLLVLLHAGGVVLAERNSANLNFKNHNLCQMIELSYIIIVYGCNIFHLIR